MSLLQWSPARNGVSEQWEVCWPIYNWKFKGQRSPCSSSLRQVTINLWEELQLFYGSKGSGEVAAFAGKLDQITGNKKSWIWLLNFANSFGGRRSSTLRLPLKGRILLDLLSALRHDVIKMIRNQTHSPLLCWAVFPAIEAGGLRNLPDMLSHFPTRASHLPLQTSSFFCKMGIGNS